MMREFIKAFAASIWSGVQLGCAIYVLLLVISHFASAQFAPMPLYQHPAQGTPDPYKAWPNCCSGSDCTPWPGEDIEAMPDGRYWIKSANGGKGAPVALDRIKHSFNGQYHLCKPIINGDPRNIETYADGTARVYCLFVPDGM